MRYGYITITILPPEEKNFVRHHGFNGGGDVMKMDGETTINQLKATALGTHKAIIIWLRR